MRSGSDRKIASRMFGPDFNYRKMALSFRTIGCVGTSAKGWFKLKKADQVPPKKTLILMAATTLLTRHGVQALSFERLAEEAGLSRQLVRYYFKDLDTLIVALSDHLAARYRDALIAGIVKVNRGERLEFCLDFFFDLAEGHPMPDSLEAYDALFAWSVGSKALRRKMCDQYKTLGDVIIHELAIAHPEMDRPTCEEISFICVSMIHAHWSFVASLGHSRQHGLLARRAVGRLIASYIADPTPSGMTEKVWTRKA